jgi:hypothetical protein
VVEHLNTKCETLSSNPSIEKKSNHYGNVQIIIRGRSDLENSSHGGKLEEW